MFAQPLGRSRGFDNPLCAGEQNERRCVSLAPGIEMATCQRRWHKSARASAQAHRRTNKACGEGGDGALIADARVLLRCVAGASNRGVTQEPKPVSRGCPCPLRPARLLSVASTPKCNFVFHTAGSYGIAAFRFLPRCKQCPVRWRLMDGQAAGAYTGTLGQARTGCCSYMSMYCSCFVESACENTRTGLHSLCMHVKASVRMAATFIPFCFSMIAYAPGIDTKVVNFSLK